MPSTSFEQVSKSLRSDSAKSSASKTLSKLYSVSNPNTLCPFNFCWIPGVFGGNEYHKLDLLEPLLQA